MRKPIKGYEGHFEISDDGRVFALERIVKQKWVNPANNEEYEVEHTYLEKERKLQPNKKGYLRVELCKDGSCKSYFVHRLVAEAFIPNPLNLLQVNHKDNNKSNNHVSNLEWITNLENQRLFSKLTKEQVMQIRQLYSQGILQKELAIQFSVTQALISNIINNKKWIFQSA